MARLIASSQGWRLTVKTSVGLLVSAQMLLMALAILPVQADDSVSTAHIRAIDMQSFGRMVISFDRLPGVEISQTNGVLVLNFDQPIAIDPSHIGLEIPVYISAARVDPDRRAIRLALAKAVRPNLIEAGNDLYVDLLPVGWKGPMPPLPAEVVQSLSRKARLADAIAKSGQMEERRAIMVDTASSSRLSRVLFRGVAGADVHIAKKDKAVELSFAGNWTIDIARLRAELPRGFASISAENREGMLVVTLVAMDGVKLDARMEEGDALVDATFKGIGALSPHLELTPIITGATLAEPTPARNRETVLDTKIPAIVTEGAPTITFSDSDVDPAFSLRNFGKVAMAAFSRANAVWIVLDTKTDPVLPLSYKRKGADALDIRTGRSGSLFYLRAEGSKPLVPSVKWSDEGADISLVGGGVASMAAVPLTPVPVGGGTYQLNAGLAGVGHISQIDDPIVGDHLMVAPTVLSGIGTGKSVRFPEFEVLSSAQGLAIVPLADDLEMHAAVDEVIVGRANGLALTDGYVEKGPQQIERSVINRARWERDKTDHVFERQNQLLEAAASSPLKDRKKQQLELARFLGANGLYREATAAFMSAYNSRIETIDEPRDRLELGILEALGSDWRPAWDNFSDIRLTNNDEAMLWRAYIAAQGGRFREALGDFRSSGSTIDLYPDDIQVALRMAFAEAAIESGDWGLADDMEKALRTKVGGVQSDMLDYFRARIQEGRGALEEAHKAYEGLLHNASRGIEVRATAALTGLDLKIAQIDPAKALETYENLAVFWRGDFLEAKLLALAARVALDTKKWSNAFTAVQRLNRIYADTDGVRPLLEEVTLRFDALIGGDQPDAMAPVDAVALFMEFREFMPTGRRADELIRKYIERLVDLDLIAQATELLRYQIEYRLEGTPRAAAAVRLASLYLIDHKPVEAVRAISETRSNGLPDDLRLARRLIEARARADLGETKAATELLEGLNSREASIVRADVYWKSKNWNLAGENYEIALGDAWRSEGALSPDDLKVALRTAASYVMAGDTLAKDRFRGRYREKLAATPESGVFRLLTAPVNVQKPIAAGVSTDKNDAGLLDNFLKSYRAHYGLGGEAAAVDGSPPAPPKPAG